MELYNALRSINIPNILNHNSFRYKTSHETAIPEWVFVLTIEPLEKNDS